MEGFVRIWFNVLRVKGKLGFMVFWVVRLQGG
jgi:hypothetical protein